MSDKKTIYNQPTERDWFEALFAKDDFLAAHALSKLKVPSKN